MKGRTKVKETPAYSRLFGQKQKAEGTRGILWQKEICDQEKHETQHNLNTIADSVKKDICLYTVRKAKRQNKDEIQLRINIYSFPQNRVGGTVVHLSENTKLHVLLNKLSGNTGKPHVHVFQFPLRYEEYL